MHETCDTMRCPDRENLQHLGGCYLTASGRGQDKRGRRRSAATPPNTSLENVFKILQNVTTCDKMWQTVRT